MTLTDLDRGRVAQAFDRAATNYDEHAALQTEVERRLLERVEYFELEPARVLDLGCGTGRGSLALEAMFPEAEIISLDRSPNMLHLAGARRSADSPPRVCADMHHLPFASRRFDLVFSSLAVQWSSDEPGLFSEVLRVLRPGGLFLFTSFGPDTLLELRSAWATVDERPHVHDFVDLRDLGDALVKVGFMDPVMDRELLTLQYDDAMTLMRDLKGIGAGNAATGRTTGLTGKGQLRQVLQAYESFKRDGHYPASYEVVYGATFGPPEGQPVRTGEGEIATFSVESLRQQRRG